MEKNEQPVYSRIEEEISRGIIRGEYPLNSFLPSERGFEKKLSASRVSIRQALKNLQEKGIIEKAQGMRSRIVKIPSIRSRNIGFATPIMREKQLEIYRMFFDTLFNICNQASHNLFYIEINQIPSELIKSIHYDAIFIAGKCKQSPLLKSMISPDTIVISLDDLDEPLADITICTDNYDGGMKAAEALYNSGCNCPAFLGLAESYEAYPPYQMRLDGFMEACHQRNMNFSVSNIINMNWEPEDDHYQKLKNYLKLNKNTDGIFVYNDSIAIRTLKILQKLDIKVPERLSMVGMDGLEVGLYTNPSLTTIVQPIYSIINTAFGKINEGKHKLANAGKIKVPTNIIYRETTKLWEEMGNE